MNRKTNESFLDRISETLNNYETVFITTYRKTKTVEDNIKSNVELKQDLIKSDYGVSNVKRIYQENKQDKQFKEKFFVVVNLKNEPNFYEKMKGCGIKYEQDSIIYSNPSIGKSVLVSLNGGVDDNFNGIKTRIIKDGDNQDQCIAIVGNREFVFKSGHMHIWENKNIYGKGYLDKILLQEEENDYNIVKYTVNESSLNKIVKALNNYESVFITTYRGDKTVKQNIDNNVNLKIKLLKLGYGVIMIDGRCQENVSDQVPKEKFFVVTNLINNPNFLESMKAFCNEYEQDAVLYSNPKDNKTVLVDLKNVGKDEVFDKIITIIEHSPDEKGDIKEKAISIIANRKFVFENTYMREYASMTIYSKCFLEKKLINEEQK